MRQVNKKVKYRKVILVGIIQRASVLLGVCLLGFVVRDLPNELGFRDIFGIVINREADSEIIGVNFNQNESAPAVFLDGGDSEYTKSLGMPEENSQAIRTFELQTKDCVVVAETALVVLPMVELVEMPLILEEALVTVKTAAPVVAPTVVAPTVGMLGLTDKERWEYEAVVWAEARGEGLYGMVKVAEVLRNRVLHKAFPNSLSGVIHANNGSTWQFSVVKSGVYRNYPAGGEKEVREAVQMALDGSNYTKGATYFRTLQSFAGSWHQRNMHSVIIYNNHVFGQID